VIDAKRFKSLRHFFGAFEQRTQIGTFYFVMPAHLLYQQLGIAFDAQRSHAVGLRIIQCGDQSVVFCDIVSHAPDVLFQLCDNLSTLIAYHHAIGCGSWISSRSSVDVGLERGGTRFYVRLGTRKQTGFT